MPTSTAEQILSEQIITLAECTARTLEPICNAGYLGYAITYLRNMRTAYDDYGLPGLRDQIIYALGNMQAWRGDEARKAKNAFKTFMKLIP